MVGRVFALLLYGVVLPHLFPRTLSPNLRHLLGFAYKSVMLCLLLLQSLDTLGALYEQGCACSQSQTCPLLFQHAYKLLALSGGGEFECFIS